MKNRPGKRRIMVSLDRDTWAVLESRRLATGASMAEVVRRALKGVEQLEWLKAKLVVPARESVQRVQGAQVANGRSRRKRTR